MGVRSAVIPRTATACARRDDEQDAVLLDALPVRDRVLFGRLVLADQVERALADVALDHLGRAEDLDVVRPPLRAVDAQRDPRVALGVLDLDGPVERADPEALAVPQVPVRGQLRPAVRHDRGHDRVLRSAGTPAVSRSAWRSCHPSMRRQVEGEDRGLDDVVGVDAGVGVQVRDRPRLAEAYRRRAARPAPRTRHRGRTARATRRPRRSRSARGARRPG